MLIWYESGLKIVFTLLMMENSQNTTEALVKLQIAKQNPAMLPVLLASRCLYWHVAHVMVTSLPFSDINKWCLTLLRLFELLRRNMLVLCMPFLIENEYFALPI